MQIRTLLPSTARMVNLNFRGFLLYVLCFAAFGCSTTPLRVQLIPSTLTVASEDGFEAWLVPLGSENATTSLQGITLAISAIGDTLAGSRNKVLSYLSFILVKGLTVRLDRFSSVYRISWRTYNRARHFI